MKKLNWNKIDDYEFVHLSADLLRCIGFSDVNVQGDGPDGGLDLFATEQVPFSIPGPQSFKWGVQCKFSVSGKRRAVNDSDIRDVEGVMRSDRYLVQDLKGYLLITNRRISQNVVERLSGINRRSQFRTAYIDGTRLTYFLSEHPQIVQKYFHSLKQATINFPKPFIKTHFDSSTGYQIEIDIKSILKEHNSVKIKALLDTGADMSIVPVQAIKELESEGYEIPYSYRKVEDFKGDIAMLKSYFINIKLGELEFNNHECLSFDSDYAIIGNDIINHLTILIDGPNRSLKLFNLKQMKEKQ